MRKLEHMKNPDEFRASLSILADEDKGGRRSGYDRRHFSYSDHIPERRSGKERRKRAPLAFQYGGLLEFPYNKSLIMRENRPGGRNSLEPDVT